MRRAPLLFAAALACVQDFELPEVTWLFVPLDGDQIVVYD